LCDKRLTKRQAQLDSVSEAAIQEALVGLMRDKTVIAIAHRLSTLRAMDRIVIVEDGQIVEDGSHEELIRLGGVYASLWNRQVSGFIPD
jgi:ABC-type multidrug transport system fused ATPase/permease subunit